MMRNLLYRRITAAFLLLIFLNGCFYRIGSVKSVSGSYIEEKAEEEEYIIVHDNSRVWNLVGISNRDSVITGLMLPLAPEHMEYMDSEVKSKRAYSHHASSNPGNEVHIFVPKVEYLEADSVRFHVSDVTKMEVYDKASLGTVGIVAGTLVVVGGIFLLIACSCPNVYAYDGANYIYQGGIFPGAINANLERRDIRPIKALGSSDGIYQLKIANERPETEFINYMALKEIEHPAGTDVTFTKDGEAIAYGDLISPESAIDKLGNDVLGKINEYDDVSEYFNTTTSRHGINEVIMNYSIPSGSKEINLILNAKNTKWMDHTFREFFSLFGDRFEDLNNRIKEQEKEDRIAWMLKQGILLKVYIDKGKGWEYYDYFNVAGSDVYRPLAMKLDISGATASNIKVKLESGFGFWEVDYAAIDLQTDRPYAIKNLETLSIYDDLGNSYLDELSAIDNQYLASFESGDQIFLEFAENLEDRDANTTIVLDASGYYEFNFDFEGQANIPYLKKFRKKGRFSQYSQEQYLESFYTLTAKQNDR